MEKPNLREGELIIESFINWLGLDSNHPDLKDTPRRIAQMYLELFEGCYMEQPKMTVFDNNEPYRDMVIIKDIPFSSVCSHHFLPFVGKAHVGYIPKDKYVGLSKIARVLDYFAKRPQIQERLTMQVADYLYETLGAQGVIVVTEARHECMIVRGVKKPDSVAITSAIRGNIDKKEFIQLIKRGEIS